MSSMTKIQLAAIKTPLVEVQILKGKLRSKDISKMNHTTLRSMIRNGNFVHVRMTDGKEMALNTDHIDDHCDDVKEVIYYNGLIRHENIEGNFLHDPIPKAYS